MNKKQWEPETIMCRYFGCEKPADHYIERASTHVCQEHLELNILRFRCVFTTTPVNEHLKLARKAKRTP